MCSNPAHEKKASKNINRKKIGRGKSNGFLFSEVCSSFHPQNGYWADHFCEEELGYICKKEPSEFLSGRDEIADPKCQKVSLRIL